MRIEPRISLIFNGDCDAALTFYQDCFGATVTFRLTWGDSPMADQAPPDWRDKILHASLIVGTTAISCGDVLPASYQRPQGFQIDLNLDDVEKAERIYATLADEGDITVPLQETFWARRFGAVVDRFGVPWGINCAEAQSNK